MNVFCIFILPIGGEDDETLKPSRTPKYKSHICIEGLHWGTSLVQIQQHLRQGRSSKKGKWVRDKKTSNKIQAWHLRRFCKKNRLHTD